MQTIKMYDDDHKILIKNSEFMRKNVLRLIGGRTPSETYTLYIRIKVSAYVLIIILHSAII